MVLQDEGWGKERGQGTPVGRGCLMATSLQGQSSLPWLGTGKYKAVYGHG